MQVISHWAFLIAQLAKLSSHDSLASLSCLSYGLKRQLFYCITSSGFCLDSWFYVLDSSRERHHNFFFFFWGSPLPTVQDLENHGAPLYLLPDSLQLFCCDCCTQGAALLTLTECYLLILSLKTKQNFSAFCSISYAIESFVFTCNLCSFQEFLLLVVCRDTQGSIVCHQALAQGRGFPPFPSQYCPASCEALLLTLLRLPWQRGLAPGTLLLPRWQLLSTRQALMTIAWPQILY